jgi:hypothetical protein
MVWWVKDLMNHLILKAQPMWDYYAHIQVGRGNIKVERNSRKHEYATFIRECSKERQSFTKGTEAQGSNITITTPTPDVSRRPGAKLHQATQGMPLLANGLVGEGLNEPPNSQGCNQCGILRTHTRGRGSIKVERNSRKREYAIVIRECKKERKRFTKGTKAWRSNTTITTLTTHVST